MPKVSTRAGDVDAPVGKEVVAENLQGFKDGETIVVFNYEQRANFKIEYSKDFKGTKHVPDGTVIDMHALDAAVAEKLGKGKIVK